MQDLAGAIPRLGDVPMSYWLFAMLFAAFAFYVDVQRGITTVVSLWCCWVMHSVNMQSVCVKVDNNGQVQKYLVENTPTAQQPTAAATTTTTTMEEESILNRPFPMDKVFNPQHMMLNSFKGLDFDLLVWRTLSSVERDSFTEFKSQFNTESEDEAPDDFTLIRFLQADDYHIKKATQRLQECIRWRRDFGLDKFIQNPNWKMINRYRQLRVRRLVGLDKHGRPLVVERLGELLGSDETLAGGLTKEEWQMCYSFDLCETMAAFRESTECLKTEWCHRINFLGDLSGGTVSGVFKLVHMVKYLGRAAEVNFPEVAGNIVMINAPSFAAWGWNLVRKLLDPKVAEKIKIYSDCPHDLVDLFGSGALPKEFGGNNPFELPRVVKRVDAKFNARFPL